jgi:dGTPase
MENKNPLSQEFYKSRKQPKDYKPRTEYFRDQTAIIHSMPFRRLKHKTQVFFAPENDHICTRIEHVLHVASIGSTICKGLNNSDKWNLDEELVYAIGIGHDLGHAPFGHAGEAALNSYSMDQSHQNITFVHEVNSYRVVENLCNEGKGLNLTWAVKDGIICHNGENFEKSLIPSSEPKQLETIEKRDAIPSTYEGCIIRFADKIAYLGRDIEDAIVAGFIKKASIPPKIKRLLGSENGEIIDKLVLDIIKTSYKKNFISFSDEKFELLELLKDFNYKNIYKNSEIKEYEEYGKRIIKTLFDYLVALIEKNGDDYSAYQNSNLKLDNLFGAYVKKMGCVYSNVEFRVIRIVTDYIAGMTDNYALDCMKQISIPRPIQFNKKKKDPFVEIYEMLERGT